MENGSKGRRTVEWLAMIAVAILTIGIMVASLSFERRLSNQKALYYQLQALRASTALYKALNVNHNPATLFTLFTEEYSFPGEDQKRAYLTGATVNDQGEVIDPFGTPYIYDVKTGWVRSKTKGYEYW